MWDILFLLAYCQFFPSMPCKDKINRLYAFPWRKLSLLFSPFYISSTVVGSCEFLYMWPIDIILSIAIFL